ncbi:MAG: hypothetical protein Q9160_007000 [Pyrenula sp. 1 TL-2023]
MSSSRFAPFHRLDLPYRTINGVPLYATVLIPRNIIDSNSSSNTTTTTTTTTTPPHPPPPPPKKTKHPLLIRFHGGGFIVGHRMYEPWFALWLLDLALERQAIVVSPDYRLLPEATGAEILGDVREFWGWVEGGGLERGVREGRLEGRLGTGVDVDVGDTVCCGESSGGWLSVWGAMVLGLGRKGGEGKEQQRVRIRAVISISAPLDATAKEYKVPRPRVFMGRSPPPPRQALAKIRAYIKRIEPGSIRTGCEPTPEMWELLLCIAQQAYLPRLFGAGAGAGEESSRSAMEGLMEMLERKDREMVPVWIVHGRDDTMCPAVCSSGFARRLHKVQPAAPVHLSLCPGEHLFDVNTGKDADWVQEGAQFLGEYWPQNSMSVE